MNVGDRVRVRLPPDVAGWSRPEGANWPGVVVFVNGDSIDVRDGRGDVEPVDAEYVTPEATMPRAPIPPAQCARVAALVARLAALTPDPGPILRAHRGLPWDRAARGAALLGVDVTAGALRGLGRYRAGAGAVALLGRLETVVARVGAA